MTGPVFLQDERGDLANSAAALDGHGALSSSSSRFPQAERNRDAAGGGPYMDWACSSYSRRESDLVNSVVLDGRGALYLTTAAAAGVYTNAHRERERQAARPYVHMHI